MARVSACCSSLRMENEYGNWREWILDRFRDPFLFRIEVDKDDVEYVI